MFNSFYGWYLKCQSDTQTLAVIPAVHNTRNKRTCSIQVITDNDVWTVTFTADSFRRTRRNIFIGENRFGENGIYLAIHTQQLTIRGKLDFGPLFPLKYDIMGAVCVSAIYGMPPQCAEYASFSQGKSVYQWTKIFISECLGILGRGQGPFLP